MSGWNPYSRACKPAWNFHKDSLIPKLTLDKVDRKEWKEIRDSAGKAICDVFRKQYPNNAKIFTGTNAEQLFAMIGFANHRARLLGNKGVARFAADAWKRGDERFFIRLGKALSKKPAASETPQRNKLRELLAQNWAGLHAGLPDLCFFTDDALTGFCRLACGPSLTLDIVRHERQRLGLKKSSKILVRKVMQKSGKILLA